MKFFVDQNISKDLVEGMKAFGQDITHLLEHFPAGTQDVVWLELVGRNQWFVITRDERIRRNPAEK